MLHRLAVVLGKGIDQRGAQLAAQLFKGKGGGRVLPLSPHRGAEEPVCSFREGGERVVDISLKTGVGGLEQHQVIQPRGDRDAFPLGRNCGGLRLAGATNKGRRMWLTVGNDMFPGDAGDIDADPPDLRIAAEKELSQLLAEIFNTLR
jgi:hypothetical protein